MSDYRVEAAQALDDHRLRVSWTDGLDAVVDFRDLLRAGGFYGPLADPAVFRDVRLHAFGHGIYWPGPGDTEIDICPDMLRARADPKAAERIAAEEDAWRAQQAAE